MRKQFIAGVVGAVMVFSAGAAFADNHRAPSPKPVAKHRYEKQRNIETRIERQQQQIRSGMRHGQLLRREARFLKDNLNGIKRSYRQANRDRRIDRTEWRRLNFMLERNGRIIRCMKGNPPMRR